MARKSKRFEEVSIENFAVIYNAGLYLRKSKEDDESIETQKLGGIGFIKKNPDICIYDIYCENGESGATLERDEFQRMMNDIYNGKVNCIIVKDLSRLIRNHIEGDRIILDMLPMLGVRIISINDNYDSKVSYQGDYLNVSIKNYFNSMYVRDLSKKITSVIRMKQLMGEFIGDYAPYGYLKSPEDKHKLIIDPETTGIVKRVFYMIDKENMSYEKIARIFTEEGIETPAEYLYRIGLKKTCNSRGFWRGETIKRIATNVVYRGHIKQGRSRSNFLKGRSGSTLVDDYILVENTHEPTIEENVFEHVQQIAAERTAAYHAKQTSKQSSQNIFAGIIFCGRCGASMKYSKKNGRIYCSVHLCNKNLCPESESITREVLKNTMFTAIKTQVHVALNFKTIIQKFANKPELIEFQRNITLKIQRFSKELNKFRFEKSQLFIEFSQGKISKGQFDESISKMDCKITEAESGLKKAMKESERINNLISEKQWMKEIMNFKSKRILSKEMLHCLIERIIVHAPDHIEIKWKFHDEFEETYCELEKLQKMVS